MNELPSGTVTFLFTDIEGSTKLAQEHPEGMSTLLARHHEILQQAIEAYNGYTFRIIGDSFSVAFRDAHEAVYAALEAQRTLHHEAWSPAPIKVRMGIHTGAAQLQESSKTEPYASYATLALTSRIMSAGHGGQILLSQSAYELTRDRLPEGAQLIDMGERRLKDVLRPERLYQLTVPDLPAEFQPLKTLESFRHNLPIQLTSFVGREKEMAEIKALLSSARLVTLMGPGGTGKTRLAIEVGTEELTAFANGVWLIELAPLADPAQIIPALAQALGLQEHPFTPLPLLVVDYLRDKNILLLLDNCEHLIEACARLADDLLHQCGGLKILASSREALGIAGEMAYRLPSLMDSESIQLFVERARAANPKFDLTESNASFVAQICSRLDGIPLAIELAAARTRLLSPEQIAARLDDRFRLLVGGSRTALPRQQTLRALIDWSYDLLSEEEKGILQIASVFVGGWRLEAIEAVADNPNILESLEQLINKSLVLTEDRGSQMRYFMLETIRQYARERLVEAQQALARRDRHFLYFDDLAENIWNVFETDNLLAWRNQADDEMENLRAALEWGLENHAEAALRLAANFCLITGWMGRRQVDAMALCKSAIDQVKLLPPVTGVANMKRQQALAKALFAKGLVGMSSSTMPLAIQDFQEAVILSRLVDDRRMLGYSLGMLFRASTFINPPGVLEAAQEGYAIFRDELNDNWGLSIAYQNMATAAVIKGDRAEKEKYLAKFKEMIRAAPLSFQAGLFYMSMGMAENAQGHYETAKTYLEEGLNVFKHLRNWNFQLIMLSELGHIARHMGEIKEAKRIYNQTLRDWQNLGNRGAVAHQLESFAFLAMTEEEPERAAKLLGTAEALRDKAQAPMTEHEQSEYDRSLAQLRSILAETEFNFLWAEGHAMTMEQAIQFALEESK